MRVDQTRHRMWLAAFAMFVLSLLITAADRTGMLCGVRLVLHDALRPERLALMPIARLPGITGKPGDPGESATVVSSDGLNAQQLQTLRQLMVENARLRRDLKLPGWPRRHA